MKESDKAYTVELAAPGMKKEDFNVHINDEGNLVVKMENKQEKKEEDKNIRYLRREFSYSKFEQTLILPDDVKREDISARVDNGVLTVDLPKIVEEKVKEQNRKLKMQGLLINDKTVLTSMEEDLSGNFIPANLKDNEIVGSVVSKEEFKMIFDYIDVCIKSMGVELFSGNIDVLPTKDACDYCQYSSVCRFEKGGRKAVFPSYKKGEELEKIKEALKNEWQGE